MIGDLRVRPDAVPRLMERSRIVADVVPVAEYPPKGKRLRWWTKNANARRIALEKRGATFYASTDLQWDRIDRDADGLVITDSADGLILADLDCNHIFKGDSLCLTWNDRGVFSLHIAGCGDLALFESMAEELSRPALVQPPMYRCDYCGRRYEEFQESCRGCGADVWRIQ